MQYPSEDIKAFYEAAVLYEERGDPYHAVKLYKKVIKLAPEWPLAYARLGQFYKNRCCLLYTSPSPRDRG